MWKLVNSRLTINLFLICGFSGADYALKTKTHTNMSITLLLSEYRHNTKQRATLKKQFFNFYTELDFEVSEIKRIWKLKTSNKIVSD